MKARKIVRRSLHEEILDQLREMIVAGRWGPCEILPELEICAELGVSRTPLREALKVLSAEGLIEVRPRSGAQIRVLSPEETIDLFEAAALVEGAAARLAATRASDAEIAGIAALHARMIAAREAGDRPGYFDLNQRIHRAIVAAGDNAVLADLHGKLLMRMRRVRFACTTDGAEWAAAAAEHGALMDALTARDGDRLSDLIGAHTRKGWDRVAAFVAEENRLCRAQAAAE